MNDNQPLVSIISPTYNHENFISDCIKSVQAQSYPNWEMIIVDDGSTDGTFAIAKKYAEADTRIKAFTQKNIGIFRLGETYNFALQQSQGKYIAILECDDVWLPHKLKIQVEALEQNPQCVLSWGKAYYSSVDLKKNLTLAPSNMDNKELFYNKPIGIFLKKAVFESMITALTIVIRKDKLLEIGGFKQIFDLPFVDFTTTLELTMNGEFAYIDQPLGHWRVYPNQVTKTYSVQMASKYFQLISYFMDRFPDIFQQLGIDKREIKRQFKLKMIINYSRSGRYKLIRKDFKGARKDYFNSIFKFGFREPVWKLRSVIGLFLSFFHQDVEWIARILGKETYNRN